MAEKTKTGSSYLRYLLYGILLYILYEVFPWEMFLQLPAFYRYSGAIICIIGNIIGTSRGMLAISNTCAGMSVLFPKASSKSIIGIVICETNLLCGIIMAYLIIQGPDVTLQASHCLFAAGLVTGFVGYSSSIATGLICAAVNVTDAKESGLFPKLVFFEFVAGSIGVLGLAFGFLCKQKAKNFM